MNSDDSLLDDDFGPSKNDTAKFAGMGVLMALLSIVLSLLFYGLLVAVVLWVALTVLQHFGVLALFVGGVL